MKLVEIQDGRLINWEKIVWIDVYETEGINPGRILCQIQLINTEEPFDFIDIHSIFRCIDEEKKHVSYAACFLQIACEIIESSSKIIIDYDYIVEETYNRFVKTLK